MSEDLRASKCSSDRGIDFVARRLLRHIVAEFHKQSNVVERLLRNVPQYYRRIYPLKILLHANDNERVCIVNDEPKFSHREDAQQSHNGEFLLRDVVDVMPTSELVNVAETQGYHVYISESNTLITMTLKNNPARNCTPRPMTDGLSSMYKIWKVTRFFINAISELLSDAIRKSETQSDEHNDISLFSNFGEHTCVYITADNTCTFGELGLDMSPGTECTETELMMTDDYICDELQKKARALGCEIMIEKQKTTFPIVIGDWDYMPTYYYIKVKRISEAHDDNDEIDFNMSLEESDTDDSD